jgi:hypothetical protein
VTDELLRTLADMRSDGNIVPIPSMTVQKKVLNRCEMAVVTVSRLTRLRFGIGAGRAFAWDLAGRTPPPRRSAA